MSKRPTAKFINPATQRPLRTRACEETERKAEDIARDANEKIIALATAHYQQCAECQARAANNQIHSLAASASEKLSYGCGGMY